MQAFSNYNDGVKYLLEVVDIFSTHGWMVPLKQITGSAVAAAFQSIVNGGRTQKKLWVDKGKEFSNRRKVVVRVNVLFFVFYRKRGEVLCC